MTEKQRLRRQIRQAHGGEVQRAQQSAQLCLHILESPWYRAARTVAGYVPLHWEADITPVLAQCLRDGKTLALPLCGEAPHMTLRRVESLTDLVAGRWGIPEPPAEAEIIPATAVDLLLVPLEGIGCDGMRLGKGGGYYDRLLTQVAAPALGCALSWQKVAAVPAEAWDRPLTACADRDGIEMFAMQDEK